jgi:hypothetical protein
MQCTGTTVILRNPLTEDKSQFLWPQIKHNKNVPIYPRAASNAQQTLDRTKLLKASIKVILMLKYSHSLDSDPAF